MLEMLVGAVIMLVGVIIGAAIPGVKTPDAKKMEDKT
jgi:hypothetical protein